MKWFKNEDLSAVSIAAFILIIAAVASFLSINAPERELLDNATLVMQNEEAQKPVKSVAWHLAQLRAGKVSGANNSVAQAVQYLTRMPARWEHNPLDAVYETDQAYKERIQKLNEKAEALVLSEQNLINAALEAENKAESAGFKDAGANATAVAAIAAWVKEYNALTKTYDKLNAPPLNLLPSLALLGLVCAILFGVPLWLATGSAGFIKAFPVVYGVGVLSLILESQVTFADFGLGFPLWAIIIGIAINNIWGLPAVLRPALQTEMYIKTGLVLLGAEVLFSKIMAIGLPGIAVAWLVTPVVLIVTYWFGQKVLKIESKSLNMTISADLSVCGVSAAVATAAACKAKKEELTLAVGLSMAFTAVMMVVLPAVIKAFDMPQTLGGAWIGGTLDSTGAVVAAGAFLGDTALNVAATIKMIQNILIGFIAFGVAAYWSAKVEKTNEPGPGYGEIWKRFPKFILGFMGVSVLFSWWYTSAGDVAGPALVEQGVARGFTRHFREWFFCLAFASIGLSTNFAELRENFKGGKPLWLYVCGQLFNLLLTLAVAYLVFGWK